MTRARLVSVLSAAVVAISFAAIFIRFAQAERVPALAIAAWRLTFAALLVVPYAWARHRREVEGYRGRERLLLLAAGGFLALHFALWIGSLERTTVASSVVLVTTGPVFVGIGSWLFLGERPTRALAIGIALAFSGSVLIGWADLSHGDGRLLGDLLALGGAVMMAGYLMLGRRVRAGHSLAAYVAPVYTVAALVLVFLALASGQPLLSHSPRAFAWLLAMALVPQLIGHSALNWALRHLSATYVAATTMAEPIGSGALAYLLLGEKVGRATLVGGVVILAGIYVASRAELRTRASPLAAAAGPAGTRAG